MNLEKMLHMQKTLDDRIINEKGLENIDLFPNTILALNVELSEFANEGRWFKHWSDDQEPRTTMKCIYCSGKGEGFFSGKVYTGSKEVCVFCSGSGKSTNKNPILEEFVDGVHFFLSIAIQKGWTESLYIYEEALLEIKETGFDGGLTGAFLEMQYLLLNCYINNKPIEAIEKSLMISTNEFYFKSAWFLFMAIGLYGFHFTPEQIEAAYVEKNAVNHERQDNGY
ncbi:dUTP diphosphatase [Neobacillus sp. MM2021_6]|uniref:dUTP diphosphatase n=1 Tax=Bacillaceae TaxID=186817 RepID=UPI00140B96D4|nr:MULTISPECIES: dUTP diphosphatase [Bacillaceae]MBO0961998.1 dUTP diphosphatase [Neobacillus sp. MM2021_6]NHC20306.1 dUTPase [Bacillus sp. MM2020_4]